MLRKDLGRIRLMEMIHAEWEVDIEWRKKANRRIFYVMGNINLYEINIRLKLTHLLLVGRIW